MAHGIAIRAFARRLRRRLGLLFESLLIDRKDYLKRNPDVARAGVDPTYHYFRHGKSEGRWANLVLSPTMLNALKKISLLGRRSESRSVLFISGEPWTPGHVFRVERLALAVRKLGHTARVISVEQFDLWEHGAVGAPGLEMAVIWRAPYSDKLQKIIACLRASGIRIVFDIDDYIFEPELARDGSIDSVGSHNIDTEELASFFSSCRQTLLAADKCIASTEKIAGAMRHLGKSVLVIPNGFDEEIYFTTRKAALKKRRLGSDGLLRIGYAAGSKTHRRDFREASAAISRVMAKHPECRLVLFRDYEGNPCVDINDYPELKEAAGRVEWRRMVALKRLPEEIARFDINIAPLECGNPFCEAKSELKFFEAALAGVPTIASPTQPFLEAINPGVTGMLPRCEDEWFRCIERLVASPGLREEIGRSALMSVLYMFGPDRRLELAKMLLDRGDYGADLERKYFQIETNKFSKPSMLPAIPRTEMIFREGRDSPARVAVVIPLYNYEKYIIDALESVADQSLESIELIVVNDASTDGSEKVVLDWLHKNYRRFVVASLLRNGKNEGVAIARNAGFVFAESPLVFPLDADNLLTRDCLYLLEKKIEEDAAPAAHPSLKLFGDCNSFRPAPPWAPDLFREHNYIDTMALVRKSAWAHAGGYSSGLSGWDDYAFWCAFVEKGFYSAPVAEAVACYRVHPGSLIHTEHADGPPAALLERMKKAHPWLDMAFLGGRDARKNRLRKL